jgi:hypothetical protein
MGRLLFPVLKHVLQRVLGLGQSRTASESTTSTQAQLFQGWLPHFRAMAGPSLSLGLTSGSHIQALEQVASPGSEGFFVPHSSEITGNQGAGRGHPALDPAWAFVLNSCRKLAWGS